MSDQRKLFATLAVVDAIKHSMYNYSFTGSAKGLEWILGYLKEVIYLD